MKVSHQLVISSLAVLVLTACSGSAAQRRQAKDDFKYLETPEFSEWQLAADATPQYYPNYQIPEGDFKGEIGRDVDIRPPQQILELIPGARVEEENGEITLWMIQEKEADQVWETAKGILANNGVKLRQNTNDLIETDWMVWVSEDEDVELGSRHEVTRFNANNRYGFKIRLIEWREAGEVKEVSRANKERYNTLMTNFVAARYDTLLREEAARKAEQLVKQIPISMGSDRSGFPVIIARTPYNVFWQRVPTLLPTIGFTLEERNQSQGTIKAKFAAPSDDFWTEIGVKPINLDGGTYTFLLGDLGNRTSINVTDSSGKPVEADLLEDLVPVLVAVIEQGNKAE